MFWIQIGLAFFAGIVVSMFMSTFISFGYTVIMIKNSHLDALEMLKNTGESINTLMGFKSTATRLVEIPNETVRKEREIFDQSYNIMKDSTVLRLKNSVPNKFKSLADYNDWEEAMNFLKQERKK